MRQIAGVVNVTDDSTLEIEVRHASQKSKSKSKHLSRLEAVKQLFHAFISRTEAYDLPHRVGLVLIGTTVSISDTSLTHPFMWSQPTAPLTAPHSLFPPPPLTCLSLPPPTYFFPSPFL